MSAGQAGKPERASGDFLASIILMGLALLALGCAAPWLLKARAFVFPDAPAGKLACVSYTPRAAGEGVEAVHRQIEADLEQLAHRTHCVRTYAVSNGLDYVPVAARKHGLKVLLGLWIGSNQTVNEQEIAHAIEVAQANKDVIEALIVGNEVLLRREQSAEALIGMLQRVRAATGLPVTYADVWDFWLKNPQMAAAASFITIHILPYWEDEPVGVDAALAHVIQIYDKVQSAFPQQRIFVGETGWPSGGRQREAAAPSLVNQAKFFREFIAYATARDLPYNFIEAFDQPWKKRLEGTVGGYWGIYDARGREKFPLTGAVREDPQWWRGLLSGAALSVVVTLAAWRFAAARSRRTLIAWACGGFAAGALALLQWEYLWQANRTPREWLATSLWSVAGYVVYFVLLKRLTQASAQSMPSDAAYSNKWAERLFRLCYLALLVGMAYVNLGLSFDARYRGFPSVFVALPVAVLALHSAWARGARAARNPLSVEEALLACWLLISALWIGVHEGAANGAALGWCVWSALLALSLLPLAGVKPGERQGARE